MTTLRLQTWEVEWRGGWWGGGGGADWGGGVGGPSEIADLRSAALLGGDRWRNCNTTPLGQQLTQTTGTFVKQVVVLTVNHRGPLPLRELHSTDETIAWRDPGGS